ncbi:MAG: DNA polymerase III subunit gamma/tau [Patescibacteria group bacterium]
MPVLYRKYRPQTFKQVVGQQSIIQTLQNQVASGNPSHAYLFVGTRGVGKTSVARILAKAVNCQNNIKHQASSIKESPHPNPPPQGEGISAGDACGECGVCKAIQIGNYIDLIEIDAASNTGVDNVRELIEHVRFAPSGGAYKIFIIDEIHMLSKGAFNALLKTLEEPPRHAIFILATTEIGKVPATIISRTQRFDFKRLSVKEIEEQLLLVIGRENAELPKEAIKLIAENAGGGLRDAMSLLDKVLTLGNNPGLDEVLQLIGITDIAISEKFLDLIIDSSLGGIPEFLNELLEKGVDFTVFNRDFLEYLRKILVLKISPEDNSFFSENHLSKAQQSVGRVTENEIIHIMRLFLRSLKEQTASPSPDLPVLLAGVEASMRKLGNSNNQPAPNHKPVKSTIGPGLKVEVSGSALEVAGKSWVEAKEAGIESALTNITLEQIAAEWPRVIEKLKDVNGPLAQLLRTAPLARVDGARVIVSVKYKFHKQNLEHAKNQESIVKILRETYGQNLAVGGEVAVRQEPEKAQAGALVDVLQVFGGELIE